MFINQNTRLTYSNIKTKMKNQMNLKPEMIIKKNIVNYKKSRSTGESEPVYEYKLNVDFWQSIKVPINVILDEAHSIVNARRAMSKTNQIVTDWIALIRRVLGQTEAGVGELVFITQLPNRIDSIARDMAHQVRYHKCHYIKTCKKCGASWQEHSEMPEGIFTCTSCGSTQIKKHSHSIEIWKFKGIEAYTAWKDWNKRSFYSHYFITDIEKYFPLYNTLQWDNLFGDYY